MIEHITLESPSIKAFSLHPGAVATDMAQRSGLADGGVVKFDDPPELAAASMLYLCTGKADWLNGRYVSVNWDLGQVEREWKDKILDKDLLVNKLDVVGK